MIFPNISKEYALILRNIQSRRGRFRADKQQYFVLEKILPKKDFQHLRSLLLRNKALFLRKDSTVRKGSAIGGHELRNSQLASLVERIDCAEFLEIVRSRTGISNLQFVPEADTNRLSLLYYQMNLIISSWNRVNHPVSAAVPAVVICGMRITGVKW